jgi:hypothetical protein
LVKIFSTKNIVTTLEHPLYYLAPTDFKLFPRLMSAMKGRRICDATEIMKNATDEQKRLSQNGFQKGFQHFYCCWQ